MNAYLNMFKNYFNFSGRTSRSDYTKASLMHILMIIITSFVDGLLGLNVLNTDYGVLVIIYGIASVFPFYSMQYRRVRDAGLRWPIFVVAVLTTIRILNYIFYIFLALRPSAEASRLAS